MKWLGRTNWHLYRDDPEALGLRDQAQRRLKELYLQAKIQKIQIRYLQFSPKAVQIGEDGYNRAWRRGFQFFKERIEIPLTERLTKKGHVVEVGDPILVPIPPPTHVNDEWSGPYYWDKVPEVLSSSFAKERTQADGVLLVWISELRYAARPSSGVKPFLHGRIEKGDVESKAVGLLKVA